MTPPDQKSKEIVEKPTLIASPKQSNVPTSFSVSFSTSVIMSNSVSAYFL